MENDTTEVRYDNPLITYQVAVYDRGTHTEVMMIHSGSEIALRITDPELDAAIDRASAVLQASMKQQLDKESAIVAEQRFARHRERFLRR